MPWRGHLIILPKIVNLLGVQECCEYLSDRWKEKEYSQACLSGRRSTLGSFDENEARGENAIESARHRNPGYCKPKKTLMTQAKTGPL